MEFWINFWINQSFNSINVKNANQQMPYRRIKQLSHPNRKQMYFIIILNNSHHKQRKREPEELPPLNSHLLNNWSLAFKPCSRVHQTHTCSNRFSHKQTFTNCLGALHVTPTHPSARHVACKSTQTYKTLEALSSKPMGTRWFYWEQSY
jgi:hypothetical protein